LNADLKIPSLRDMNIQKSDFAAIIDASKKASSTKGNPITLTDEELARILAKSF